MIDSIASEATVKTPADVCYASSTPVQGHPTFVECWPCPAAYARCSRRLGDRRPPQRRLPSNNQEPSNGDYECWPCLPACAPCRNAGIARIPLQTTLASSKSPLRTLSCMVIDAVVGLAHERLHRTHVSYDNRVKCDHLPISSPVLNCTHVVGDHLLGIKDGW